MSAGCEKVHLNAAQVQPAWKRHLRDPDLWHTAVIAGLVFVASLGSLWFIYFWRAWRTARTVSAVHEGRHCLLVFGKRLAAGAADADLLARVRRAHALVESGAVHTLVLLGGRVGNERSEAEVTGDLLRNLGLPPNLPIFLEEISGDTLENLRHARGLLAAQCREPGAGSVVLLSNRYHLARCSLLAANVGLEHAVCAAEDSWRPGVRHWFLLAKEASLSLWLHSGIRWARLIGHRRMLSKLGWTPHKP
ncbi:MAG: YdcF family protein [Pseudomonadota bacterium]|nr:YdcF family protein [Pseudomonadota bacterium]